VGNTAWTIKISECRQRCTLANAFERALINRGRFHQTNNPRFFTYQRRHGFRSIGCPQYKIFIALHNHRWGFDAFHAWQRPQLPIYSCRFVRCFSAFPSTSDYMHQSVSSWSSVAFLSISVRCLLGNGDGIYVRLSNQYSRWVSYSMRFDLISDPHLLYFIFQKVCWSALRYFPNAPLYLLRRLALFHLSLPSRPSFHFWPSLSFSVGMFWRKSDFSHLFLLNGAHYLKVFI